jgi:hypothetical protein
MYIIAVNLSLLECDLRMGRIENAGSAFQTAGYSSAWLASTSAIDRRTDF